MPPSSVSRAAGRPARPSSPPPRPSWCTPHDLIQEESRDGVQPSVGSECLTGVAEVVLAFAPAPVRLRHAFGEVRVVAHESGTAAHALTETYQTHYGSL